jgi:hypothetical protein
VRWIARCAALLVLIAATGACGSSPPGGKTGRPDFVLEGTVEGGSGAPLGRAGIVLVGSSLGGLSASDGSFRVAGVAPPDFRLAVLYLGYRSQPTGLAPTGEAREVSLPMTRDASLGTAFADTMAAVTVRYTLRVGSGS